MHRYIKVYLVPAYHKNTSALASERCGKRLAYALALGHCVSDPQQALCIHGERTYPLVIGAESRGQTVLERAAAHHIFHESASLRIDFQGKPLEAEK